MAGDPPIDGGLDRIGGPGVDVFAPDCVEGGGEGRVRWEAISGDDVEVATADEDAVGAAVGVQPAGEGEGSLDEEEFAIGVPDAGGEGWDGAGGLEKEEDHEPLIIEVVAEASLAVEVGEGRRATEGAVAGGGGGGGGGREGGGDGEVEGLVLPHIVAEVGGEDRLDEVKVEGVECRGGLSRRDIRR